MLNRQNRRTLPHIFSQQSSTMFAMRLALKNCGLQKSLVISYQKGDHELFSRENEKRGNAKAPSWFFPEAFALPSASNQQRS